jgi:soluble lytic murein transglycosylase-like protein
MGRKDGLRKMHWWIRTKGFLKAWIGEGILFSVRRGLWLSRLNATILLLLMIALYGWQYGSLALNQSRLEHARAKLKRLQTKSLLTEDDVFAVRKRFQALQKSYETFQAVQMLTGDRLTPEETAELANIVLRQSALYGYDPLLIVAIIQVESRFRTAALGKFRSGKLSGATGLMQIKPSTVESVAQRLGIELPPADLMDAETNVIWGITYLTRLLLHFRDLRTAIIAYNMGMGEVKSRLERGEILPKRYYHQVMDRYDQLKNEFRG